MPISKKSAVSKKSHKKISAKVVRAAPKRRRSAKLSKRFVFVFLGVAVLLLSSAFSMRILTQKPECANSISCVSDLAGTYDSSEKKGTFEGKTVFVPPQDAIAFTNPSKSVLGESVGPKKIMVDLTNQRLYAYEGDTVVMDFPVSTGKWWPTPTGEFDIWVKLRYTKMEGGSKALGTYYYLPNVPYTMFYSNSEVPKGAGYSIHGAYWHDNFGAPMSHGCVNMRTADAGQVFEWADPRSTGWANPATASDPGTKVIVYGETPKPQ